MTLQEEVKKYNDKYIPTYQADVMITDIQPVTYRDVSDILHYASCIATVLADSRENIKCPPETFMILERLFITGAVQSGCLPLHGAKIMAKELVMGRIHHPAYVYQFLAYILRYEPTAVDFECNLSIVLMMPLIAASHIPVYQASPEVSSLIVSYIQYFLINTKKYAKKTLIGCDPLRLVDKLKGMIHVTSKYPDEGISYLEYTLDGLREIATLFLSCVVRVPVEGDVFAKHANALITRTYLKYKTVSNTDYMKTRTI